jgi:CubicO group peptidase (beta-lactamase class C family)
MTHPFSAVALAAALCATTTHAALDPGKLAAIGTALEAAVADERFTGAVCWVERGGEAHHRAFGNRAVVPEPEPMTEDTVFDVASLTKVVATAPSVMVLVDRGQVDLGAPVSRYLPEFRGGDKAGVTVRQLLTHFSGLPPIVPREPGFASYLESVAFACWCPLRDEPGSRFRYSDVNYITLADVVRRVSGQPLDVFAREHLFRPLGMSDTSFNPPAAQRPQIAPTELTDETGLLRGVVHDPSARVMGGTAGHAGLFSTAHDLARYCRAITGGGGLDGARVLSAGAVETMTTNQSPPGSADRRGIGWDIETAYSPRGDHFSADTFGHTGWTGQAMWIDRPNRTFAILLTTRNHPFERRSITDVREAFFTLAAEAAGLAEPADPSTRTDPTE